MRVGRQIGPGGSLPRRAIRGTQVTRTQASKVAVVVDQTECTVTAAAVPRIEGSLPVRKTSHPGGNLAPV